MKYAGLVSMLLLVNACAFGNVSSGSYSDGSWTDPGMWWEGAPANVHRIPNAADTVIMYINNTVTLGAGNSSKITQLDLGGWNSAGYTNSAQRVSYLIINGSLETTTYSCIGYPQNTTSLTDTMQGVLTMNTGGILTCDQGMYLGCGNNGTIYMNGGNINVAWWIGLGRDPWNSGNGVGTVYLHAGTIQCGSLYCENDGSQIVVGGGTLKIGTYADGIAAMNSHNIVAATGKTLQYTSYNGGAGIQITAIPEPLTMTLLGIGGLFLARRNN